MKIADYFKKQSRIMQIICVIFVICFIYDILLIILGLPFNGAITTMMGFTMCVIIAKYLIS